MKTPRLLAITLLLSLITIAPRVQADSEGAEKFRENEFTIDLFGSYKHHDLDGDLFEEDDGVWGGGVGVNYFFTRMFGIGAETTMHDNGRQFIDNVCGHLTFRVPIGCFAPYAFGGAGRDFDPIEQWEAHAGGGVEIRFNPHTGVFVDGRYAWADKTDDYSLFRAGVRFGF